MRRPVRIAVIGAGSANRDLRAAAQAVGRLVAERGGVVICGGLGGVMEAACQGAVEAGGLTVGILPGGHERDANPWVVIPVPTGLGYARNVLVANTADSVIAVGGKLGTLSEIAFALKRGAKVFGVNSPPLPDDRTYGHNLVPCESPEDAVERAFQAVQARG